MNIPSELKRFSPLQDKPSQAVVVIIPFYNGSKFIGRALLSIFEQTIPANEVIVVNDGSKAPEMEFLIEIAKKFPIKVIHKENGGQGSARNLGVEVSNSEYICFLDQDDFYLPNHIEVLLNAIPTDDLRLGVVYGDLYEADAEGNILRMGMIKSHSSHPKREISSLIGQDMFILPSASIIKRKVFQEIGGFDTQFKGYEDDDLFLRMFRAGYSNYFVDKPVTVWCIHSASTSYSVHMSRSRFKYFCKLSDFYPDSLVHNRYYFRDLLLPRFGSSFIKDAVEARLENSSDMTELMDIFSAFTNKVQENAYVSRRYKLKLKMIVYALNHFPVALLGVLLGFAKFSIPFRRAINF